MKICADCFQDQEIQSFIRSKAVGLNSCEYCLQTSTACIDSIELLDFFSDFIGIFVSSDNGTRLIDLIQKDWVLFSNASIGTQILNDVLPQIGSHLTPITEVSYLDEILECVSYWEVLKDELKYRRRFLTNIEQIQEYGWDALLDTFIQIDSTVPLFRSRIHTNGDTECIPNEEMGCPPNHLTCGGRANPDGIPYLYLSKEMTTTVYETRSLYLDLLTIGSFRVIDNATLILLDFAANISPFYYDDMIQQVKRHLLRHVISQDLSKPLRRFDSSLEYIPTQFICEFIRYYTGVDGVQFKSSLYNNGINVVLFDPSNVECIEVQLHQVKQVNIRTDLY